MSIADFLHEMAAEGLAPDYFSPRMTTYPFWVYVPDSTIDRYRHLEEVHLWVEARAGLPTLNGSWDYTNIVGNHPHRQIAGTLYMFDERHLALSVEMKLRWS